MTQSDLQVREDPGEQVPVVVLLRCAGAGAAVVPAAHVRADGGAVEVPGRTQA